MKSTMRSETLEIPTLIAHQLHENAMIMQKLVRAFQDKNPCFILTVARGSSDHAATFLKYLCETELGLPVSSAAPSVYTVYHAPMLLKTGFAIALSQSGQSPDICEVMRYATNQGALTLALVNAAHSPLTEQAQHVLPLCAGPEHAVAATKSFVAMLIASLHFVALVKENSALITALHALPAKLTQLEKFDFIPFFGPYFHTEKALVIGRGFNFAIAQEIALKLKEVTQIHAEGFSGAEVLHGPFSLFHENFPVLILLQNDASLPSMQSLINKIRETPVKPILIGDAKTLAGYTDLLHIEIPETHPLLTPVLTTYLLYQFIEQLAQAKGLNPDQPPLIQKVTKTL